MGIHNFQDKEVSKGGSAPRMLCLDDYFMIEVDRIEKDPESGKRVKKKVNIQNFLPEFTIFCGFLKNIIGFVVIWQQQIPSLCKQ